MEQSSLLFTLTFVYRLGEYLLLALLATCYVDAKVEPVYIQRTKLFSLQLEKCAEDLQAVAI